MIHWDMNYNVMYEPARMWDTFYMRELSVKFPHAAVVHSHTCKTCGFVIIHTRLEALRGGDLVSHTCCGRDVRVKQ